MSDRRAVARLRDVAEAAGVSVTSVSRYLNGSLNLPDETASRIDTAIKTLGYRPNPHARSLSLGRSNTIGLVIPDIANPFFAQLAASVEAAADDRGLGVLLCATLNRAGREHEYLERLRRNHVDALLFITNHPDDGSLAEAIGGEPRIALLDEDIVGTKVPKVFSDNFGGGYAATAHLVEAGHRRIAFLGGPREMMSTRDRMAGCRKALSEAGSDADLVAATYGDYSIAQGRAAAENLLGKLSGATAVIAASDGMAVGLMEVLVERSLTVPGDLSIVTFDDVEPVHLFNPPLTAIHQPVAEMGRRGVEIVARQARGETPPSDVEHLACTLIARASVATPANKPGRTRLNQRRNQHASH
ncbi:LacI family DNA-binding transcriptional regulator [Bauldia sp.]|uniref:LacI family DNA-binding transcriptional regulator n=1 Tax=Bauldia sp. TaxID=2575872 RepID=UPI003BAC7C2F